MYKPLPESVTIKPSDINGLGLFATEGMGQGTNLGTTHIKVKDKIIRFLINGDIYKKVDGFYNFEYFPE